MDLTLAQARTMSADLAPMLAEQQQLRAKLDKHEANERRLRAKGLGRPQRVAKCGA